MGNNVFSTWLKELISLIFVQAFQAFLLAVVMSMIVAALAGDSASVNGGVDAVGLFSIFALASLSKIELLIKRIFGLTSGVADTSLAAGQKSSFVGGMLAYRAGKRLLDNPAKVIGGAKNALQGQLRLRKAKNDRNDAVIASKLDNKLEEAGQNLPGMIGAGSTQDQNLEGGVEQNMGLQSSTTVGNGNAIGSDAGNGAIVGGALAGGAISSLSNNIAALTDEIKKGNINTKDNNDRIKQLENAINDAKKQRNEGLKTMFSGVAETIGAAHGAVAGAAVGLGTNEKVMDSALKGAGMGDVVGEAVAKALKETKSLEKDIRVGIVAEGRAHISPTPRKAYNKVEKEIKRDAKAAVTIDDLDKKLKEYTRQQTRAVKSHKIDDV